MATKAHKKAFYKVYFISEHTLDQVVCNYVFPNNSKATSKFLRYHLLQNIAELIAPFWKTTFKTQGVHTKVWLEQWNDQYDWSSNFD